MCTLNAIGICMRDVQYFALIGRLHAYYLMVVRARSRRKLSYSSVWNLMMGV